MKYIDITAPITPLMPHWPGQPAIEITKISDMNAGDKANVTFLSMSGHTGTHMDAPNHFIKEGVSIEQMPLEATIGPARVIEIKDKESIKIADLEKLNIKEGERLLFKTQNSYQPWASSPFMEKYVYISNEAADYLALKKVLTVGVDYLSIGGYHINEPHVHNALLGAGIWVIEGLALKEAEPGDYHLMCLPIKVVGADGVPVRAVLTKTDR